MNLQEVISQLKHLKIYCIWKKDLQALDIAIKVLEKQVVKKPKDIDYRPLKQDGWRHQCPVCGYAIGRNKNYELAVEDDYCPNCGQKIDWGI